MLVAYCGRNEVIVCNLRDEEQLLEEYFKNGKRDINDYDRATTFDIFSFTQRMGVNHK